MTNPWITHCKSYHSAHPHLKWSEVLKQAKGTYHKKQAGKGFMDIAKKGHELLKKHRVISGLASKYAHKAGPEHSGTIRKLGDIAHSYGYGLHKK